MYDIFYIGNHDLKERLPAAKSVETFEEAKQQSLTKMFWVVWPDIEVSEDFDFSYKVDVYDQAYIHVFKNGTEFDGICLFPKDRQVHKRELDFMFFNRKKEVEITASTPKPYDIVFISYNEPNADTNYKALQQRFPRAKRVHGVKGIHNAHIAAAKLCDTDMFWIVDGDAQIVEDFDFNYQVPKWRRDQVFVWHSQNPINNLVYGYGGVKLFPRKETLLMDTDSADMTTSISSKFNVVEQISNITAFNTGAFETWKSAFRECAKLASKSIDRQDNEETEHRLETWTTVGSDREFGKFSISGACAGREYGYANKDNTSAIALINDFDWLEQKFKEA
jgi:hypothetical protein